MKTCGGCTNPWIPDIDISWRLWVSFTSQPSYPRNAPEPAGRRGEERNIAHTWTRTPIPRPSSQYPVTTPTALSQIYLMNDFWRTDKNKDTLALCSYTVALISYWYHRESSLESREYSRRDPSRWPRGALYPQKLSLTSRQATIGIVRSRTQATEFSF
jgi:hypothetical protein